jgi:hypothetical protein
MQQELISRIRAMEEIFDSLLHSAEMGESPDPELLALLTDYYDGGQWLSDYEMDEQGLIPPEVKRGVLSQDGIYNLLARFLYTPPK